MFSRQLVSMCVLLGLAAAADAQRQLGRQGRDFRPPMEKFAGKGTIEGIARDRIQILTDTDQRWMIFIDEKTVVHVVGTAEADFLRPGLWVQFTADFDKRGKAKDKVKKLAIFTPRQQMDIGFWPEGMVPIAPAGQEGANPGRGFGGRVGGGADGGAGGGADGGADGGAGGGFGGRANAQASSVYTVHGQIRGIRKGLLTVQAGRAMFQFTPDEKPEIAVDFADYSVAKPGDKISITKGKMFQGRLGLAQALEMTITLSEPLALPKKKPRRTVTKPPPKKPVPKKGPKKEAEEGAFDTPR